MAERAEPLADGLLDAARTVMRAAARAAGPGERMGLTGAQMDLLVLVGRNPDLPVAQVAARLGLARNTVSTLVGQLCQAGLLERVSDARDARVARLRLRASAEERMAAWRRRRVVAVGAAAARLSEADRAALAAALPALRRLGLLLEAGARAPGDGAAVGEVAS